MVTQGCDLIARRYLYVIMIECPIFAYNSDSAA